MEKTNNKRRLYRMFLQPKFQLKYASYFMTLAISSLFSTCVITIYLTLKLMSFAQERPQEEDVFKTLAEFVMHHFVAVASTFGVLACFYLLLAIVFTKRIVGPIQVLVRHIEALKVGDYSHKTHLRKGDELGTIMTALNELSEILEHKKAS